MNQFLGWQMDYVYFFYGLSFMLLAAVCFTIYKTERQQLPWIWLVLFGIARGSAEWLNLFLDSYKALPYFPFIKIGLLAISFVFLAEFGRASFKKTGGRGPGRWVLAPLLALTALGGSTGPEGLEVSTQYVLGLVGGLWAALALVRESRKINYRAGRWMAAGSLSIGFYSIIALAAATPASFFPANTINNAVFFGAWGFPVQAALGFFVMFTAAAVWACSQVLVCELAGSIYREKRSKYAVRAGLVLVLILCLGWGTTRYMYQDARNDLIRESVSSTNALSSHLQDKMDEAEHAVIAMAGSPWIAPALLNNGETELTLANSVLDLYQGVLDGTVCYIMDTEGTVTASSNRNAPDSYAGKNYGFRPYFQQALNGNGGSYFAKGITSAERGHYAGCPVLDEQKNVVGVAVIKSKFDNVETSFKQYQYSFCIDPNGIIFMSSRPDLLFSSFWPVEEDIQKRLVDARQFGAGPFKALLSAEATDGEDIVFGGQRFLASRKFISPEGWSILLLAPTDDVRLAGLSGILITFCFSMLTIIFFVTTQRMNESAEQMAISEVNYSAVFNGVNEAIFVLELSSGNIIDANQKACDMFGCTREEALNAQLERFMANITPYVNDDALLLMQKAAEGEEQLFDWLAMDTAGKQFWGEINLKRALIGGRECLLVVIRDITRRRLAEEETRQSEALLRSIVESPQNMITFSLDNNYRYLSFNQAHHNTIKNIWGADIKPGKSMLEYITYQEDREKAAAHFDRALSGEHFSVVEEYGDEKLNRVFWEDIYSPIIIDTGEIIGVTVFCTDISARMLAEEKLQTANRQLLDIIDFLPDATFAVDREQKVIAWNRAIEEMTGVRKEDMLGRGGYAYAIPFYGSPSPILIDLVFEKDPDVEKRYEYVERRGATLFAEALIPTLYNGKSVYIWGKASPLYDSEGKIIGAIESIRDITERKRAEEALRDSEVKYRTVFENTGTALAILEEDKTISLVNTEFSRLSGYSREEIEGRKSWAGFIAKKDIEKMLKHHDHRRISHFAAPVSYEFQFVKRDGITREIFLTVALIPGTKKSVASFLDITERKQAEEQLKFLSLHDPLTGLYNRTFFEEEMRRLEGKRSDKFGIVMCDVDGLKLVNDTLGHKEGDKLLLVAAAVIKECFREGDMVARIGGDEFAVLLPDTVINVIENASQRIKHEVEKHNAAGAVPHLSISIGYSINSKSKENIGEVFKEADNNMYREKLHSGQSARSAIVQTLMKALEARDFITEGHADRLQEYVDGLAVAIGLPEHSRADLRLLAKFHDIGKVGIPDRILFKPAALTDEECMEMKRHSEIGHRIAQSAPDLSHIAGWILRHHEWWDGNGYPLGLKGEEIPLECRVLTICDAYEAMTSDRPYHKAAPSRMAIAELKRCAGTQFDAELVKVFLRFLQRRDGKAKEARA